MNKILILLAIGCLGIGSLLVGCSGKSAPEPGRYYDRDRQFSIKFPDEWMIREGDGEEWPKVEAVSPWENDYDEFSEHVTVDVEYLPVDTDLDTYFEETVEWQIDDTPGYRERGRGDAEIDDVPAKWVTFDFESEGGTVTVMGYSLLEGKTGYLISCVAQAAKFSSYKREFEDIVKSFRVEQG
jgi:hypothetical protein